MNHRDLTVASSTTSPGICIFKSQLSLSRNPLHPWFNAQGVPNPFRGTRIAASTIPRGFNVSHLHGGQLPAPCRLQQLARTASISVELWSKPAGVQIESHAFVSSNGFDGDYACKQPSATWTNRDANGDDGRGLILEILSTRGGE